MTEDENLEPGWLIRDMEAVQVSYAADDLDSLRQPEDRTHDPIPEHLHERLLRELERRWRKYTGQPDAILTVSLPAGRRALEEGTGS